MAVKRRVVALSTAGVFVGLCLVAVGIWATSAFVDDAVERDASRRSLEWSNFAAETLTGINAIVAGAKPDMEQQETLARMAEFGGVFRFKIFSPDGKLRFVSDDPNAESVSLGSHNPAAASVVDGGQPYTVVADGTNKPNRPDLYSETYLPIVGADGKVLAIAETYLDQTETTKAVRNEYLIYGLVMMSLVFLALLIPSVALLLTIRRLRERNLELDAERVRAQQADLAKTQFVATVSHELRTPMNGIIGAIQLLELADLDEDDVDSLEILKTCSESQLSLIEELLTFGSLEADGMNLFEDVIELAPAMKTATGFATIAAADKGISFDVDVAENTPALKADFKRLQQIVVNLVGNAIKFTETGGVTLHAALTSTDMSDTGVLKVSVMDTGPGIPLSEQARVFERFTQVDESSTRSAGGTGLGLPIARGIARVMGGDITLESTPGKGSTFVLEVPVPIVGRLQDTTNSKRDAA
ncbi:hypothetical protein NBRC116594_05600 [Shimia sp. NS0008-38b]|uniref:sensor histidine kinase n=1 Tax=Shimia sp. NS0008-38b TaxID=3127653 RepID=UPI00310BD6FD